MRYFLIDFENVQGEGLRGIESLKQNDQVVIFYSKKANKLTMEEVQKISQANCQIEYIEIEKLGHNALDFNLVYFIGIKSGKFRGTNLYMNIVSKDTGFDTLKDNPILKSLPKVKIERKQTIAGFLGITEQEQEKALEVILTKKALEKYTKRIANLLNLAKSKREFHNELIRSFGSTEGLKIYTEVKSSFSLLKAI